MSRVFLTGGNSLKVIRDLWLAGGPPMPAVATCMVVTVGGFQPQPLAGQLRFSGQKGRSKASSGASSGRGLTTDLKPSIQSH